jgi:osmoprotectant transport system ATP-binding protein
MIRLEAVTKNYVGHRHEAVHDLTMSVAAGEIVVLVGPSGCGKTTTLRLINRLIEPTSGRIFLDGADVTRVNPDLLRRRIGYVIQQVGLFPHLTVAGNVGVIPRALGWDRSRVRARVDELLELVGLDPGSYRGRYPKQLSGGQQQRVGVARALAADPPVMLMDEPFGAIDPINRERLQDEFRALQTRIRKTVVIVTHDIQEAIKLGDRIAIFSDSAKLEQYDTPAQILARPANEFVKSFIGAGAAIRGLSLRRADSVLLEPVHVVRGAKLSDDAALAGEHLLLVDGPAPRWMDAGGRVAGAALLVAGAGTLYEAVDAMLRARADLAVVADERGNPLGVLTWDAVARSDPGTSPSSVELARAAGGRQRGW